MTVHCFYPAQEDYRPGTEPPEEYGEWRPASGQCTHEHCIEADYYARLYRNAPREPSKQELAEMNADLELVMDETGGRGF